VKSRRHAKVSALEHPQLDSRPRELEFFYQEQAKVFLVILYTALATVVVLPIPLQNPETYVTLIQEFHWIAPLAVFFMLLIVNLISAVYLELMFPDVVRTTRRFILVGGVCLGVLLIVRLFAEFNPSAGLNLLFFAPISFAVLVFAIVYNRRFAVMSGVYLVVLSAILLYLDYSTAAAQVAKTGADGTEGLPDFLLGTVRAPAEGNPVIGHAVPVLAVHLITSMVAVLSVAQIRNRSKLIKVGAVMGLTHAVLIALFMVIVSGPEIVRAEHLEPVLVNSLGGFLFGLVAGFLLTGALPFIEYIFEVSTDISLLELTDQNHPILRRLLLEAPGTYHHSFIVGTLAESAAGVVGANALLARVGGYYHDIGKLIKPEYFTENETRKGSHHEKLSPTMSTLVIIAHIKDGMEIALDYNLPPAIQEFIPQHHGTSVVEYFFHEAQQQAPDQPISRDFFRYLGPKPRTKETAIVFLADSVEAASRSLADPTPARIRGLVHKLVNAKLMDNQLDESRLSFRELKLIEESFVRVLSGIFHGRIAYPETAK
jgi:putative nucleotidyltransferase with HDIG domain